MASMKYGDVRRRFNTSILCGWVSGQDQLPHLNPQDDYVIQESDKLIFLANTGTLVSQHQAPLLFCRGAASYVSLLGWVQTACRQLLCFMRYQLGCQQALGQTPLLG